MNAPIIVKAGVGMVALAAIAAAALFLLPETDTNEATAPSAPVAAPAPRAAIAGKPASEAAAASRKLDEAMTRGGDKRSDEALSQTARAMGSPVAGPVAASAGVAIPAGALAFAPPPPMAPAAAAVQAVSARPAGETDEVSELCARAKAQLQDGAVSSARLLLTRAARGGAAEPLTLLAQTYDPKALDDLGVEGVKADPATAKKIYAKAAASGSEDARRRLAELR